MTLIAKYRNSSLEDSWECQLCGEKKPKKHLYTNLCKVVNGVVKQRNSGLPLCHVCGVGLKKFDPNLSLDPIFEKLIETDKAYLAGIIDGEGCIGVVRKKTPHCFDIRLTIANTSVELLEWVQNRCGGLFYEAKHTYKKGDEHDPRRDISRWKPRRCVIFTNQRARSVLYSVGKYLVIKKAQCSLALDYFDLLVPSACVVPEEVRVKRIKIFEGMRFLNKRGITPPNDAPK